MINQTPDKLWSIILRQLQLQMTQDTFDTWLKNTRLINANDHHLVIAAENAYAKDWLENRLLPTIKRTITALLGYPVNIQFIIADNRHPPEKRKESPNLQSPTPGQSLAQADYYAAHFGSGGSGYGMLDHYSNQFWMPYLESLASGTWALYLRLAGQKRSTVKRIQDRWTDPRRYTYRELAQWLNLSHTRKVAGCIWECYRSRVSIRDTGQALPECCNRHSPIAVRIDQERRPRCVHWKRGLLEILHSEHLVAIKEIKAGTKNGGIRSHLLKLQTWRLLPLLTPIQAGRLNSELQLSHASWINDFGYLLGLEGEADWEPIVEASIVPHMTGYRKGRQLHGPYHPHSHFDQLRHACRNWPGFTDKSKPTATCMSQLEFQ